MAVRIGGAASSVGQGLLTKTWPPYFGIGRFLLAQPSGERVSANIGDVRSAERERKKVGCPALLFIIHCEKG